MGFPDGSDGKQSAYNARGSRMGKIPWGRKGMATPFSILAWRIP